MRELRPVPLWSSRNTLWVAVATFSHPLASMGRDASWPGPPADSRSTLCSGGGHSSLQRQGCLHLLQVQVCNQGSALHACDAHVEGSYEKQQALSQRQLTGLALVVCQHPKSNNLRCTDRRQGLFLYTNRWQGLP